MHFAIDCSFVFLLAVGLKTCMARKEEIDHEQFLARNHLKPGAEQFKRQTPAQHASVDGPRSKRSLIIGGAPTSPNEFPFMAVTPLQTYDDGCGAVVIHPDILLTAASCSGSFGSGVVINPNNRSNPLDGERLFAELLVMHPLYDSDDFFSSENNIMIVKLLTPSSKTPVKWNRNASNPQNIDLVTLIGMGANDTSPDALAVSETLLKAKASIINFDTCNGKVGGIVSASMFCTGKGKGECSGDVGSPVLDALGTTLIGIASQVDCDYNPSVHTRVSYFSSWIDEMICTYSATPPAGCSKGNTTKPQPPGTVKVLVSSKVGRYDQPYALVNAYDQSVSSASENDNVIVLVPGPVIPGTWRNETYYLPPSRYTFGLYELYGSGVGPTIFVDYGGGNVSKLVEFKKNSAASFPFWLAGGDYQPQAGNPSAPPVNVTFSINFTYCDYVATIKDMYSNSIVRQFTLNECYNTLDGVVTASLALIDGRSYVLGMQSIYSFNGFYGSYKATTLYSDQGPGLLFSGLENFNEAFSEAFVVSRPTCYDKKSVTCTTAAGMVEGSSKKRLYCKIPSVASACPYSCGTCF